MTTSEYVSLKEHFDTRIAALEKATEIAANALEKRLVGLNEYKEMTREFPTRQEIIPEFNRIKEDIRTLRESKAMLEGKASQKAVTASMIIAGLGLIIALISLFK